MGRSDWYQARQRAMQRRAYFEALERQLGSHLDGMTDDQLQRLPVHPYDLERFRRNRQGPVRNRLLEALDELGAEGTHERSDDDQREGRNDAI